MLFLRHHFISIAVMIGVFVIFLFYISAFIFHSESQKSQNIFVPLYDRRCENMKQSTQGKVSKEISRNFEPFFLLEKIIAFVYRYSFEPFFPTIFFFLTNGKQMKKFKCRKIYKLYECNHEMGHNTIFIYSSCFMPYQCLVLAIFMVYGYGLWWCSMHNI